LDKLILLVLVFSLLNNIDSVIASNFQMGLSSADQRHSIATEPLLFSTATGIRLDDSIISVGFDDAGDLYIFGENEQTGSDDDPQDCYIKKVNGTDFTQIYMTVFGGSDWDVGTDMFVDPIGRVYVTGYTKSPDFPVQNAFCQDYQNSTDCFVICFDTNGEDLLFSTYLGGSYEEEANSIFVDSESSIYVTGETVSNNFPVVNSYANHSGWHSDYGWHPDVFVAKFNSTGNGLVYSSLIGGNLGETATALAVDSQGNAYVAGITISEDFPTVNVYDEDPEQVDFYGSNEGFVFCLNSTGNGLVFSTLVGGNSSEFFSDIGLDSEGDIWVCGSTKSVDFPTRNSFQEYCDWFDCIVFELNSNGSMLLFSTVFGGQEYDMCYSLDIDERDNVYITGGSNSEEFPLVRQDISIYSFQQHDTDCFVMKISPGGTLLYSTFIGGSHGDWGESIAVDENGATLIGGITRSDDFPLRKELSAPADDVTNYNDGFAFILLDISDEDGDNIPNWWEIANDYDPLNPDAPLLELLSWYAPMILAVTVVASFTVTILWMSRHRIKSIYRKDDS
jgi:hypothetical protein